MLEWTRPQQFVCHTPESKTFQTLKVCPLNKRRGKQIQCLTLSLWMTLEESAKRIQPLRGPREQSSVSTTLILSGFLVLSPSSYIELRLPPDSSSSSPRRNRDRNRLPTRLESSSSSSYRPKVVLKKKSKKNSSKLKFVYVFDSVPRSKKGKKLISSDFERFYR